MQIENSDKHFGFMFRFMQLQAFNLARTLLKNGINDAEKVENISTDYLSSLAHDFDECAIVDTELAENPVHPSIAFSDKPIFESPSTVLVADGNDAFHETMPYGVVETLMEMLKEKKKFGFTFNDQEI